MSEILSTSRTNVGILETMLVFVIVIVGNIISNVGYLKYISEIFSTSTTIVGIFISNVGYLSEEKDQCLDIGNNVGISSNYCQCWIFKIHNYWKYVLSTSRTNVGILETILVFVMVIVGNSELFQ